MINLSNERIQKEPHERNFGDKEASAGINYVFIVVKNQCPPYRPLPIN